MLDPVTEKWCDYFEEYEKDAVGQAIQQYPKDTQGVEIDYRNLRSFDSELAQKTIDNPRKFLEKAEDAVPQLQIPHAGRVRWGLRFGCRHSRTGNMQSITFGQSNRGS